MNTRPYQAECVDAIFAKWASGKRSPLAVLATALGKTIIAAEVIRRIQPERTLILANRDTLIYQARDKVKAYTGLDCDIEMADLEAKSGLFANTPVVISTVQTQNAGRNGQARMNRFRPDEFGLIICDEAHHFVAPSCRKNLAHYTQNRNVKILGLTATPDRLDKESLGQIFDCVAYEYAILDGIRDGWLVDIDQFMVPVRGLDYSNISTTMGDLNSAQLARVMEEEHNIQGMVQPTIEVCWGLKPHTLDKVSVNEWGQVLAQRGTPKRAIVFCASVAQAQRFADVMNRVRSGMAVAIWDKVTKEDRRTILKDFESGSIQILTNVGICGEGYDNPKVEVIVMARATKSRSLYTQFIGRATRTLPHLVDGLDTPEERVAAIASSGKPRCTVVDFVGNSGKHKLITVADILGGKVSGAAVEMAKKRATKSGNPLRMSELLQESEEVVKRRIEMARLADEARKQKLVLKSQFTIVPVSPFDAFSLTPTKSKSTDVGKRLSEKQLAMLRKAGIDASSLPYEQGRQLFIEQLRRWKGRLCTLRQAELLSQHGYNTKDMTAVEATALITAVKNNGWKRPPIKVEDEPY